MKSKIITIQRLLNDQLVRALPPLYATEDVLLEDKLVICKFHMPSQPNGWAWYVFEGRFIGAKLMIVLLKMIIDFLAWCMALKKKRVIFCYQN
jgi:hypothetical protein